MGNGVDSAPAGRPAVSVVIPVRGHSAALELLLDSLRANAPEESLGEIVVVQDGPGDDLGSTCARHRARLIVQPEHRGPASARNAGAAAAASPLILLMDADVRCPPGLFEAIHAALDLYPDAGAISFLNPPYDPDATAVANFVSTLEYHWLHSFLAGRDVAPLEGVNVRSAVVRKSAFDAVRGFDTSFNTNAIEDYDFGKRFSAAHVSLVAAAPLVPHAYPRTFFRLVRNYWVRTSTFMTYVMRNEVSRDPVQTTRGEAALRILGSAGWLMLLLAAFARSAPPLIAAAVVFACYALCVRSYLANAAMWSGSKAFAATAFVIHAATAPVIAAAGLWGTARALFARREAKGVELNAEVRT